MRKKLLFIGGYPPPYGGIASHLYELLPQLIKAGYEVISLTPSLNERVIQSPGMKNIFINVKKYFLRNMFSAINDFIGSLKYKKDMKLKDFFKVINFSRLIIGIIHKEKIDATFIYDNYNGLVIPILKKYYKYSNSLVFMIFGDFYLKPEKYKKISGYLKTVFTNSDIILSSSQYCADSISKILGYDFPVKVIYIGVDHQIYAPAKPGGNVRAELGIPQTSIVFLFLGRMTRDMGLDFLLENSKRLLNINPDVYLIIAGAKGELSTKVIELSNSESRIKYCPNIPFERKVDYYTACDVFIAPTMEKQACMGVSIKEAMACAKPVIASASGGIPEAIENGVNGYLIPIKEGKVDGEAFLHRAKRLLNDPLLRVKMGEKGREKTLNLFTNDQTTQKYLEILGIINLR